MYCKDQKLSSILSAVLVSIPSFTYVSMCIRYTSSSCSTVKFGCTKGKEKDDAADDLLLPVSTLNEVCHMHTESGTRQMLDTTGKILSVGLP